jgi:hypothetical protein
MTNLQDTFNVCHKYCMLSVACMDLYKVLAASRQPAKAVVFTTYEVFGILLYLWMLSA